MASFLEKLKKIFAEPEPSSVEEKIETIAFEQIYEKLNDKIKENAGKENQLKRLISEKISQLELKINPLISVLSNVDLSRKKEHEKIKQLVLENLNLYLSQVQRLLNDLKNTESLKLKDSLEKIFSLLNTFSKVSYTPFEKATILIGQELADIKILLRNFVKDINEIAKSNEKFFEEITSIDKISLLFNELKQTDIFYKELEENIKRFNDKIENLNLQDKQIKEKIDSIKDSRSFKEDLKLKEQHKESLSKLDNDLQSLKQKMNFKLLSRTYHSDPKKSQLINEYSNNFKSALKNDSNLIMKQLLKDAHGVDFSYLEEIKEKLFEFDSPLTTETDKQLANLEEEMKRLNSELTKMNSLIEDESKKKSRLLTKKEQLVLTVKDLSKPLFTNLNIV